MLMLLWCCVALVVVVLEETVECMEVLVICTYAQY